MLFFCFFIFSTGYAFAALKEDGSVVTWGFANYGGDSSSVQSQLTNVVNIFSTSDGQKRVYCRRALPYRAILQLYCRRCCAYRRFCSYIVEQILGIGSGLPIGGILSQLVGLLVVVFLGFCLIIWVLERLLGHLLERLCKDLWWWGDSAQICGE